MGRSLVPCCSLYSGAYWSFGCWTTTRRGGDGWRRVYWMTATESCIDYPNFSWPHLSGRTAKAHLNSSYFWEACQRSCLQKLLSLPRVIPLRSTWSGCQCFKSNYTLHPCMYSYFCQMICLNFVRLPNTAFSRFNSSQRSPASLRLITFGAVQNITIGLDMIPSLSRQPLGLHLPSWLLFSTFTLTRLHFLLLLSNSSNGSWGVMELGKRIVT